MTIIHTLKSYLKKITNYQEIGLVVVSITNATVLYTTIFLLKTIGIYKYIVSIPTALILIAHILQITIIREFQLESCTTMYDHSRVIRFFLKYFILDILKIAILKDTKFQDYIISVVALTAASALIRNLTEAYTDHLSKIDSYTFLEILYAIIRLVSMPLWILTISARTIVQKKILLALIILKIGLGLHVLKMRPSTIRQYIHYITFIYLNLCVEINSGIRLISS